MGKCGVHRRKKRSRYSRTLTAALLLAATFLAGCSLHGLCGLIFIKSNTQVVSVVPYTDQNDITFLVEPSDTEDVLVRNPIDFQALKQQNEDVYAWIEVPGTNISLPVAQNMDDEDFYLTHDLDGDDDFMGIPYTQPQNDKDFSDSVTVIYGHTLPRYETMFTELHKLEDPSAFAEIDRFYIFTPHMIFTYEVIAAYEFDNRHILRSMGFVQDYFDEVLHPRVQGAQVREGATLDVKKDRIVQLSTCTIPSDPERRFIVTGVLVSQEHC